MTLKTSLYNYWHIFYQKLWLPALLFLVYLLSMPIATTMRIQNALQLDEFLINHRISTVICEVLSDNPAISAVIMLSGLLAGMVYFSYLHNRQQSDFFHSLPGRRDSLFAANFIVGALSALLPYLINLLLTMLIISCMGYGHMMADLSIGSFLLTNIIYFISFYSVMVLAAVLSGHRIVQVVLALVMFAFIPAVIGAYAALRMMFQPAWYHAISNIDLALVNSSSVLSWFFSMEAAENYKIFTWPVLLRSALCIAAAWLLYRIRPSEAAGRALSFSQSRPLIKYPITLLTTIGGALLFYKFSSESFLWFYIGAALGAFIPAQIMEIVYRFDFRAMFRKLLPTACLLLFFIGGSWLLKADVFDYNSYVPQPEQVVAVDISLDNVAREAQSDNYYHSDMDQTHRLDAPLNYNLDNILRRGHTTNPESIAAVCALADMITALPAPGSYNYYSETTQLTVRYYLADGSEKVRNYPQRISIDDQVLDLLSIIFSDDEFLDNYYHLFHYDANQIRLAAVRSYAELDRYYYDLDLEALPKDVDELLKVYKEELLALDGKDRRSMVPVGEISFLIFNEDPGEISLTQNKDGSYNYEISYSTEGQAIITQTESTYSSRYTYGFDPGKSYNQVNYPLYAEFTHTMSLLEEMGYTGWEVDMSLVSHAEFYTYEYIYPTDRTDNIVAYEGIYDEKFLEDSRTIEDKDELARLIAETYSYDAFSGNGFLRLDDSCCLQIYDIYDNSYDRYYVLH